VLEKLTGWARGLINKQPLGKNQRAVVNIVILPFF
jgi:hypothetical protein